jgi:hypothetical protein
VPSCFRTNKHSDELGPRIVGDVGVAGEAGRDPQPTAILVRHERDVVDSAGAALRALSPYIVGERLLPRESRAKRRRRFRQRAQPELPQARPIIAADSSNRVGHFAQLVPQLLRSRRFQVAAVFSPNKA